MSLKKLLSILSMLAISAFFLSSCEDPVNTEDPAVNTPKPVTGLAAGAINKTTIELQWDASASAGETWFAGYVLEINDGTKTDTVNLAKDEDSYQLNGCVLSQVYTFSIHAVSDAPTDTSGRSTKESIKWATSEYFTGTATESTIRIYGSNSAKGSGLQFYDATDGAPRARVVEGAAEWNLGLDTKNNKVIFGSAANLDYAQTMSNSASITPVVADVDVLPAVFTADLSNYGLNYSSMTFNLKDDYSGNQNGIMFFAKTKDNHYARIVVKKINGSFLQNAGTNDEYVEVLVSYQPDANKPYAKISGK